MKIGNTDDLIIGQNVWRVVKLDNNILPYEYMGNDYFQRVSRGKGRLIHFKSVGDIYDTLGRAELVSYKSTRLDIERAIKGLESSLKNRQIQLERLDDDSQHLKEQFPEEFI